MILFLTLIYVALIAAMIKIKVLPNNLAVKLSPIAFAILLLIFLFVPMQWGAPTGSAVVLRHSVQIVPNVAGQVTEVPIEANQPVKKGTVLFRIDPTQYKARVDQLNAQLELAQLRLEQFTELQRRNAGNRFQVEEANAGVRTLKAQLEDAKWQLDSTTIKAPADGFATAIALRSGARVAALPLAPAMAFIDTSETIIAAQIGQIYARHIKIGSEAEITFKVLPGQAYQARVDAILPAISEGQVTVSGLAASPRQLASRPFVIRLKLDQPEAAANLPAGTFGQVAIYTSAAAAAHPIRRVMLRMQAWMNYLVPF